MIRTIDPVELIWRAFGAGEINAEELVFLQAQYAPRCSFDANPAVIRDDRVYLCEACAAERMPRILERVRLDQECSSKQPDCTTQVRNAQTRE